MTDHSDIDERGGASRSGGSGPRRGRPLATALAGLVVMTVAGGWAYDHRTEYGIAYAQLFDEAADACPFGTPVCTTATAEEGPACCHADGSCLPEVDPDSLSPVEAPKPPTVLSRADATTDASADL